MMKPVDVRVAEAVAEARGITPEELVDEPLASVIDPDALEALAHGESVQILFSYQGYRVLVHSGGEVDLWALD